MNRHLAITYNSTALFDGDVAEIVFTDSDAGVSVQGKMRRTTTGNSGGALMQLLAGAAKQAPTTTQENSDG